jgi:hypothetical protein
VDSEEGGRKRSASRWAPRRLSVNREEGSATSELPTTQYDRDITLNSMSNKSSTSVKINQEAVSSSAALDIGNAKPLI